MSAAKGHFSDRLLPALGVGLAFGTRIGAAYFTGVFHGSVGSTLLGKETRPFNLSAFISDS